MKTLHFKQFCKRILACSLMLVSVLCMVSFAGDTIDDAPVGSAQGIYLADAQTGIVLFEQDAHEQLYPASTTKIMTALLVMENITDFDQTTTIEEVDFEGVTYDASVAGFQIGEVVTIHDLVYGLMLPSGNEAARALARVVAGDVETFVDMMNARALALGCTDTHFMNPNGLHDDDHYSTAYDLFLIAQEALTYDFFSEVVNTAQKTLSATNLQEERKIYTTNMLIYRTSDDIYYDYCVGVKTGYTSAAGYCLVSSAAVGDSQLISVVLGCERGENTYASSFYETKSLFQWAFANYSSKTMLNKGTAITEVPVRLSSESDSLVLVTQSNFRAFVLRDSDIEQFEMIFDLPESVDAPISAGDAIGTVTLQKDDVVYDTVTLVALSDVALSEVLFYADQLDLFLTSSLFGNILVGIVVMLCLYALLLSMRRRYQRKRRRKALRAKRQAQEEELRAREYEMNRK